MLVLLPPKFLRFAFVILCFVTRDRGQSPFQKIAPHSPIFSVVMSAWAKHRRCVYTYDVRSRRAVSCCTAPQAPARHSSLAWSPMRLRRASTSSTVRRSWACWRESPSTSCEWRSTRLSATHLLSSSSTRSTQSHRAARKFVSLSHAHYLWLVNDLWRSLYEALLTDFTRLMRCKFATKNIAFYVDRMTVWQT